MRLGLAFPQVAIGGSPETMSSFAQTVESVGFTHLALYDHIVGADRIVWPDLAGQWRAEHEFHDVFVAIGFLGALTTTLELSVQVLVLPQRQVAAVARQAASAAQLTHDRLRLGIGVGWNPVEFAALGTDFHNRGRRMDEQIVILSELLAGQVVTFAGEYHTLDHVALNPVPSKAIPLWFGGGVTKSFERVASFGQGWISLYDRPGEVAAQRLRDLRTCVADAERDPKEIGVDVWVSMGGTKPADWRREIEGWRELGVTHLTLNTTIESRHHHPIDSSDPAAHLDAAVRFREAVADLL